MMEQRQEIVWKPDIQMQRRPVFVPRVEFCPVEQSLSLNDEAFFSGVPGAACTQLSLEEEWDRLERNRAKRRRK